MIYYRLRKHSVYNFESSPLMISVFIFGRNSPEQQYLGRCRIQLLFPQYWPCFKSQFWRQGFRRRILKFLENSSTSPKKVANFNSEHVFVVNWVFVSKKQVLSTRRKFLISLQFIWFPLTHFICIKLRNTFQKHLNSFVDIFASSQSSWPPNDNTKLSVRELQTPAELGCVNTRQFTLTLYSPVVTICTTSLTFNNCTFCPHSVFMCFVFIWEQTAIISPNSIN